MYRIFLNFARIFLNFGQLFDTMIVALSEKEWSWRPIKI